MPVIKRRSAGICQRKNHYFKKKCMSDLLFQDHGYCSSQLISTSVANDKDQIQPHSSENSQHNYWTSEVISDVTDQEKETLVVENGHVASPSQSLIEFKEGSIENEDPLILLRDEKKYIS